MPGKVEELKEKEFNDKTKKGIVLLDFWAKWCHTCKTVEPHLDEIANKYHGKMKFYKVNVNENPWLSSRFGVMSLPNILILKNGKVIEQIIGLVSKKAIEDKIKKVLL
ncbi:MAG: Thioredoxin [Berkelbacteria bacterium GW2011_GWB1_38_5]|uniref:Thioredoxin n=2 Tax=Candidatus Berkelbacteria TaxID=1618330 RepID=A0A0G0LG83_9BACT|nr:MAG: Thioredoxin [Berkelbacteria bacterium GW2011_GWB1_38_5]KKQ90888.1 MAG: Thioredoxin [Berkelbacteria bacterium GW2011_GWA1_39_10]